MVKKKSPEQKITESQSMFRLPLRRIDGSSTGVEVELDSRIFGLERNDHVLYLAVKAELSNRRQGTHATKTRTDVSGGGKKPWKQKGRGTARSGSTRSPIWRGGGTMHGPQPHDHLQKVPAKVRRLARRVALSVKAQNGLIDLVEDFNFDAPKTKQIASMLSIFGSADKSALIMLNGNHPNIVKSAQNIPRVEVRDAMMASTYDILRAKRLVISRSALDNLVGGLANDK